MTSEAEQALQAAWEFLAPYDVPLNDDAPPSVAFRVRAEPVDRWLDVRWLLGWRWKWTVWAWDEEEQRWRPPAFVCDTDSLYYGLVFDGRTRSRDAAAKAGTHHVEMIRRSMEVRRVKDLRCRLLREERYL